MRGWQGERVGCVCVCVGGGGAEALNELCRIMNCLDSQKARPCQAQLCVYMRPVAALHDSTCNWSVGKKVKKGVCAHKL